jgi:protein TonB
MLAYAANRRRIAERKSSPNAMLLVACAHIAVVAAVMSAKMDLPRRIFDPPTTVIQVPIPPVPAPVTPEKHAPAPKHLTVATPPEAPVPDATHNQVRIDPGPTVDAGTIEVGGGSYTTSYPPKPVPVSSAAQLLTSGSELKPPYPQAKLLNEEEAALRLRLTIDDRGRVIAVDPIGAADPVFLGAARRHLLSHWRYKPAMQDGRAIASSIVITLRFELDG